jgi:hypothetical protein
MSFLSKLGVALKEVGKIALEVGGVAPLITPLLGAGKGGVIAQTAINDLTKIGQVVVQVETALGPGNGAQKLKAAVNLVRPLIETSELLIGKKFKDSNAKEAAIEKIVEGVADLLNSADESNVHN